MVETSSDAGKALPPKGDHPVLGSQVIFATKDATARPFVFEKQPIMRLVDGGIFAYELLYRGLRTDRWDEIDHAILESLALSNLTSERLFINLAHSTIAQTHLQLFLNATLRNEIYFELSESFTDEETFNKIATKVNALCACGVNVALDDFGSGYDGFKRLSVLDRVGAIKIDGNLLVSALRRSHVASSLRAMVSHWNEAGTITIAECVETPELLDFAASMNFAMVQGFHVDALVAARR